MITEKSMSETADGVVWVRGVRQKNEPGYEGNLVTVEVGDSETVTLAVVENCDVLDASALIEESQAIKHMLTVVKNAIRLEKLKGKPLTGALAVIAHAIGENSD